MKTSESLPSLPKFCFLYKYMYRGLLPRICAYAVLAIAFFPLERKPLVQGNGNQLLFSSQLFLSYKRKDETS